jgi:HSP20 family protein
MDRFPKFLRATFGPGTACPEGCQELSGSHRFLAGKGWNPNTDILETEEAVHILLDLAGIERKEIKVEFRDDLLKVSGVRRRAPVPGVKRFHRMEIDYGPFEKLFRIPPGLDLGKVEAVHQNGFLDVVLPKKEAREPVRIVIVHEDEY